MQKSISVLGGILSLFLVLLPFGVILSSCFGYTFELVSYSLFASVTALLAGGEVVLCTAAKEPVRNGFVMVLLTLSVPLSFINAVFYMFICSTASVMASMLICLCCCCCLTIKYRKSPAFKITVFVLSVLMVLSISAFGFVMLSFGNIGQNTVVQTIESPNGIYYVEVIDSDQGALGGDTFVDVYENKGIDGLFFRIAKKPQRVYIGEWGESQNMKIYWKDDNCIMINSVAYSIKQPVA